MAYYRVFVFAMAMTVLCDVYIEGKSLGALANPKEHSITRRQAPFIWHETCPPPAFILELERNCTDTCHSDDDCLGSKLCCDNGCRVCLDPVLPPPVIDWLSSPLTDHRGFAEGLLHNGEEEINLVEPHYEEVVCAYGARSYTRGEIFYKGCQQCQCTLGGITCQVGPCIKDEKSPPDEEQSGEQEFSISGDETKVEALSGDNEFFGENDHSELKLRPFVGALPSGDWNDGHTKPEPRPYDGALPSGDWNDGHTKPEPRPYDGALPSGDWDDGHTNPEPSPYKSELPSGDLVDHTIPEGRKLSLRERLRNVFGQDWGESRKYKTMVMI